MNILQLLVRSIIRRSFHLSVHVIEQFNDMALCEQKTQKLREMPEGTLGRDIADCLVFHKLRLVPGYESHDLKHVLLDFKMTPVDEIRLQAFMLGNGNWTPASFTIFQFGAMLLPDLWSTLYEDFRRGQRAKPIGTWTIEDYAHCQTSTLRDIVLNYASSPKETFIMTSFTKFGAFLSIILGSFGMLVCLPFLFSASTADLLGAGFPFVGGAIIAGAGLITLAHCNKTVAVREAAL